MVTLTNGHSNGLNGHLSPRPAPIPERFADIPPAMDIPVSGGDVEEAVEVNLEELLDDPTELCTLLENENVAKSFWMTIALAYAKQRKVDHAIEMITKGLGAHQRGKSEDKLSLLACLCWLYLWKCRDAPRLRPEGHSASEARNKEFFIQAATSTLNEASRISPSYPPLFLARGVLNLLRASLQFPKTAAGQQDNLERAEILRQAARCFEDALRTSNGKNIMAVMGKARAFYSLGKYAEALHNYQLVLERAPELVDPDPRIGIGCCFWQLGYKEDAQGAWERALELRPDSKIANILLGLYYLHSSAQYPTTDPQFAPIYKKAMTQYTQKAFKLDDKLPLTCATFGSYFLLRKAWPTVERLARRAIESTDVSAIASDGWYLLARKEHYERDYAKASDYYGKADQARGGDERGYLPAKFGAAQLKTLTDDPDGAKARLEKIVQHVKSIEAMTLLGTLYAADVFSNSEATSKEDRATALKKAIAFLEQVRIAWKDPKRNASPDSSVLLNLARLYEFDQPEKSLQCLQQVEQMELDEIPDEEYPEDIEDDAALKSALREQLSPQLLNNMGCFYFQADKLSEARAHFQVALNASVKAREKDSTVDDDALVTTISYNLARTYEAEGMLDEAKKVYEGLLERHPSYTDASIRLTYIALRQSPSDAGPKAMRELYEAEPSNLEVRALYGWFIGRAKKRTANMAEDQEQRHYKHTLQIFDKHDRYSLTGMGNLYLATAREMRRDTDQEKERRSKTYTKAVEFFDKALQLDPRNAYAAQGLGIAMVEDKKDFTGAIQVFSKVKETLKDASVFINLGHVFCEVKQYARAIESYEAALSKDRTHDPQILACLGRVWLQRGRVEKSLSAMKTSLEYSARALEAAPDQVHFRFNVAFVQIQIAQLIYTLPEGNRTLPDVETASQGLDEAIETFSAIAKGPNPPFPRSDIEQRANMGRNTMRKQLERAVQSQREYEQKNASRLESARQQREAALRRREEERKELETREIERRQKIKEERERIAEEDRKLADRLQEEAKAREEADYTTDEETGEKKKKEKRKKAAGGKRKKKGTEDTDTEGEIAVDALDGEGARKSRQRSAATSTTPASDGEDRPKKKKRRKLERKSKGADKFKSAETVVDSDTDEDAVVVMNGNARLAEKVRRATETEGGDDNEDDDGEDADATVVRPRKKPPRVIDDNEDEDDDDDEEDADVASPPAAADDPGPEAEQAEADVSMVDETVAAAGSENAPDS
ncbi:protein required for normal CLN1 and CLN2 G1 cyclin expression [Elasticomyces elasticus]|nr:protein required for normal CLN1 and CLN2 G1 cyclin expression [Elasticomyces elasticus]